VMKATDQSSVRCGSAPVRLAAVSRLRSGRCSSADSRVPELRASCDDGSSIAESPDLT
jgi:hypothetical protein